MTTYLNTFTGSTIAPANASLSTVQFQGSTTSIQLVWNLNGYDTVQASQYFAATYVFTNSPNANSTILLPNAQQVSPGIDITFLNTGSLPIALRGFGQSGQAPIFTLGPSQSVKLVLQDNTTTNGAWEVVTTSSAGGLASIVGLAGRGITTRLADNGTTVFDTVWPPVANVVGGEQTLYAASSSQVLAFRDSAEITLSSQNSPTDVSETPFGTYFIIKNLSTGRITVDAAVLDGITNGEVFVPPGAYGIFIYGGSSSWVSLVGSVSQGTSINSSSGIAYNATIVDCVLGQGASGTTYTLTNEDFGTVIEFQSVQNNQVVVLPARVAVYVVHNDGTGVQQNITFRGAGSIAGNTVVLAATQYTVLATDGIGNVYPGISSLPGGQLVNAAPGGVGAPGIFFDPDEFTGWYSNGVGDFIGTTVHGLEASTLYGDASNLTWTLGTAARPVNGTVVGNLTVTGIFNALGGIDGGVI